MTIELSYWDMFWLGVTAGWVLCWYVPILLNITSRQGMLSEEEKVKKYLEKQEELDMRNLGYLPVNQPKTDKSLPERPRSSLEVSICLKCLRVFAREKGDNRCWCGNCKY